MLELWAEKKKNYVFTNTNFSLFFVKLEFKPAAFNTTLIRFLWSINALAGNSVAEYDAQRQKSHLDEMICCHLPASCWPLTYTELI